MGWDARMSNNSTMEKKGLDFTLGHNDTTNWKKASACGFITLIHNSYSDLRVGDEQRVLRREDTCCGFVGQKPKCNRAVERQELQQQAEPEQ